MREYLIIGPPYKLKGEQTQCKQVDGMYFKHLTVTVDQCFKKCKRESAEHFIYGRKGEWTCKGQCQCWCFLQGCVEEIVATFDLYELA